MRVRVVSPWYPDLSSAYSGIFVKKQVDALKQFGHQLFVDNPELYPAPAGQIPERVWGAIEELAAEDFEAAFATNAEAVKVPTPVPTGAGFLGRAESFQRSLGMMDELRPRQFDLTHAHLGIPTGLALTRMEARPLVVTEHQSTLVRVFGEPGGPSAYRTVVERADAFVCVSDHLKGEVLDAIGEDLAWKIEVIPNIVDLTDVAFRVREPIATSNWIYVGTIAIHKGMELLLHSFKEYWMEDPDATLTLVGGGPHQTWVRRFAAASGFASRLTITGAVDHSSIGGYLDSGDVFVHLSQAETFGIASLEAIAAGLPVVSLGHDGARFAWGDFEEKVGRLLPMEASAADVVEAILDLRERADELDLSWGRGQVELRYSAQHIGEQIEAVYLRVLE